MSEEVIIEQSKFERLTESVASASAPAVLFFLIIVVLAVLLAIDKLTSEQFMDGILSGVLVALVASLFKRGT